MPQKGDSNENPQHTFLWRNKKIISIFQLKKMPYLELYSMPINSFFHKLIFINFSPNFAALGSSFISKYFSAIIIEPVHNKTYNKTNTSKISHQSVRLLSMARVLVYPSLDSLEAVEGIWDQQILCVDAQSDLSLH